MIFDVMTLFPEMIDHVCSQSIIGRAKEKNIIIVEKDKRKMDEMAQNQNYQGVIWYYQ